MHKFMAFFLSVCAFGPSALAKEFNILSYGVIGSTLSGELILAVEELEQNSAGKVKIVTTDLGISYRQGDLYLLTKTVKENEFLDLFAKTAKKTHEPYLLFESARSMLLVPPSAPKEFLDFLKGLKNTPLVGKTATRYWLDLEIRAASSGAMKDAATESEFQYFELDRDEWKKDRFWHTAFYMTYSLDYHGQIVPVTVLPKEYGALWRAKPTLKSYQKKDSLIVGTGLIPAQKEAQYALELMSDLGEQYVAASLMDIVLKKEFIDPYVEKWNGHPPIRFLSANVYLHDEEDKKKEARLFPPYKVIERDGLKIGLVAVTDQQMQVELEKKQPLHPWLKNVSIKPPLPILQKEIIPELRMTTDLIILVHNLNPREQGALWAELQDVDIVVAPKRGHIGTDRYLMESENYRQRYPQMPLVEIPTNYVAVGNAQVSVIQNTLRIQHRSITLDQSLRSLEQMPDAYTSFTSIFTPKDIVLPDHRKLYPNDVEKISPDKEEFARLAAETLRKATVSEVGIFSIQTQSADLPGDLDSSILRAWVRPEERLVVTYLSGAELTALIGRAKLHEDPHRVAVAGVDAQGRINGIPIQAQEHYRIAASTAVTQNTEHYPGIANTPMKHFNFVREAGPQGTVYREHGGGARIALTDLLTEMLSAEWKKISLLPEADMQNYFRGLYEGKTQSADGYWLHAFKAIRLEYSSVRTTDTAAFANVVDSRLVTTDQKIFGGSIDYSAFLRKQPYITELGIRGLYSKLELGDGNGGFIENVLADDLVFFANIGIPTVQFTRIPEWAAQAGPFVEIAYDSEFERNPGQNLEKSVQGLLGWKFYDGAYLQSLSLAALNESDLTRGREQNEWGFALRFDWQYPFFGGQAVWRSDADYRYYFDSSKDDNDDLRYRFTWDNYLDMQLFGKFTFGPYFKYFSFAGKTFDETGTQTVIGVNLNFSSLWKPKYQAHPF